MFINRSNKRCYVSEKYSSRWLFKCSLKHALLHPFPWLAWEAIERFRFCGKAGARERFPLGVGAASLET